MSLHRRHAGLPKGHAATYVNLMDQYHPCYRADRYPPLERSISPEEYARALTEARRAGLHRFDRPRRW